MFHVKHGWYGVFVQLSSALKVTEKTGDHHPLGVVVSGCRF